MTVAGIGPSSEAPASGAADPDARTLAWIDGARVDPRGAHVSAFDRGFTLGDGLFETMRSYGGAIFRLDRHLERLAHGAAVLGLALPCVRQMLAEAVACARDEGLADGAVRLTVSRGIAERGLAPPAASRPTVVVAIQPLGAPVAAPLNVCIARGRRNEHALTAGLKTLGYLESVLALAEARAVGADDALFLDTAGHLSEATASNLFLVAGTALLTPPLSCGVLPGITRAAVLELAPSLALDVHERVIQLDDLRAADEAFLTSSLREIAPLGAVDGHPLPPAPGPVTRRVTAAFAALVQRECPS